MSFSTKHVSVDPSKRVGWVPMKHFFPQNSTTTNLLRDPAAVLRPCDQWFRGMFLGPQNDASGRRPLREKIGSLGEKNIHTPGVTVFQAFSKRICNGTSHLIDLLVMWSTWLMFLGWQLGARGWCGCQLGMIAKSNSTIKQPNILPWNSWWSNPFPLCNAVFASPNHEK